MGATAEASKTAREALDRAMAAGKLAEGKLLYETVLSDDKVKFGFDKAELSADAKAALDAFATQLKTENKNVYVEIQGHTDNVGGEDYNNKLGDQRAKAVKDYLGKQGIPLFRMETISYGETAPVADNASREAAQPTAASCWSSCSNARDTPARRSGAPIRGGPARPGRPSLIQGSQDPSRGPSTGPARSSRRPQRPHRKRRAPRWRRR